MKTYPSRLLAAAAAGAVASMVMAATPAVAKPNLRAAPAGAEVIPGHYICVFSGHQVLMRGPSAEANRVAGEAGGRVERVYSHTIKGFSVQASEQAIQRMLMRNISLSYCEPDQIMRLDPQGPPPGKGPGGGSGGGGSGGGGSETVPWGVQRVNGGSAAYTGGHTAWIIDTGVDLDHPELNVDRSRSIAFARQSDPDDRNGHGTHVAGTVAAIKGNGGVVGVAPGATVVAVRVLESNGSGSYSDVIAGVDYVGAHGATGDVANMSLGGPYSQALNDAVVAASGKGVKFAIAAGNSGADAGNYSPASANGSNIYTVSAFSNGDNWASFSNYGNPPVDYAEPGVSILSTWKGGGYNTISGTSMASPHMAGVLLYGSPSTSGHVNNDPDGNADPIGAR